jgi:pimeloyl-ACP methyl ester carboxylesterase
LAARTSRYVLFDALRDVADVVTFDQRGTGQASPKPNCAGTVVSPLDRPGDADAALAALVDRCRTCAARLRAEGHDPAAYSTVESARDIDRLRIALGAEKITLWGTSYGTHLALAYARLYPDHVERLVLAGVEGPDHTYKLPSNLQAQLEKLAAWYAQDPLVAEAIPDFVGLVRTTLARVEREPVVVEFDPPGSSRKIALAIGKWDLQLLTANAVGRTRTSRKLPALYYAMSQGDFTTVAPLVRNLRSETLASPMSYLMDGASGATRERLARIEREAKECLLGDAANYPFPGVDAAWNPPDLGDEFRALVRCDAPALFISGSLDGRTPPSNAEEVLQGFPNGRHLVIDGAGHDEDLFSASDEMRRRIVAFVAGQEISTETIVIERPKLEFPGR